MTECVYGADLYPPCVFCVHLPLPFYDVDLNEETDIVRHAANSSRVKMILEYKETFLFY